MILLINTIEFGLAKFWLIDKQNVLHEDYQVAFNQSYKTLEFLLGFLKQKKVEISDLTKIVVCSGPGSFTGIRVGVALGQSLSFGLNIPFILKTQKQLPENLLLLHKAKAESSKNIKLFYGQKPNITKPKKKIAKA